MPVPVPAARPGRRSVLRAGTGVVGLGGALLLAGCSEDGASTPGSVLRDLGVGGPAGPSERELRRRRAVAGALLALDALEGAGEDVPGLRGRFGGPLVPLEQAQAVHAAHLALLDPAGSADAPGRTDPAEPTEPGPAPAAGPVSPEPEPTAAGPDVAGRPPAVVLTALVPDAARDAVAEAAEADADLALAVLHARLGACRAAQAGGLGAERPDGTSGDGAPWPNAEVDADARSALVAALQHLLAQEHRARWSFAVVQAWATERTEDAGVARSAHTERVEDLQLAVDLLGEVPVRPEATYPTDEAGRPVDGPATAGALALRLEDAVTRACGAVLVASVGTGSAEWVAAAVRALGEAERGRWSWEGAPDALPGS